MICTDLTPDRGVDAAAKNAEAAALMKSMDGAAKAEAAGAAAQQKANDGERMVRHIC